MELIELPNNIMLNIIGFINTTEDFNNLRCVNKLFHELMIINKKFEECIIVEIYTFLQNKIFSDHVTWYNNGCIKTINKYNTSGVKHDIQQSFYINTKHKNIEYYRNGNRHGKVKEYYPNGQLKRTCHVKNNNKIGTEFINNFEGHIKFIKHHISSNRYSIERYHDNNIINYINLYKNKLYGECKIYRNGVIKKTATFINGKLNGKLCNYNMYGLDETITYINNIKTGSYLRLNNFGDLNIHAYFKKNKLDGLMKIFNEDSINTHNINFKDGKLHGEYTINNIIKKTYNFNNGQLDGYYMESYHNNIKIKIKFLDNKFGNIYKKYDIDGKTLSLEILFTPNGYIIHKYKNGIKMITIHKINNNYYYSKCNTLIRLNSYYMNPVFINSVLV
jgi:antitoxin component YwqK of YwqJK toxin-antitoxin module